ncbi:related to transcription activator protein acu-15 [Rhynchosporium agropyri]|uniref:Related to transcription activator protein acu-15 n=1 Tax=Rhynchosporium agropyri TaxID=914238 RepID=A0A1E1KGZ1_9HELO|nr:related to transcription activator protein acu-15 [Rhynchosporium agropyri]
MEHGHHLSPISPASVPEVVGSSPPTVSVSGSESIFLETSTNHEDEASNPEPPRKRQKRNKPTLSCEECVERKTKCDRERPVCTACTKRQRECSYITISSLKVSEEDRSTSNSATRVTKPPQMITSNLFQAPKQAPNPQDRSCSHGSISSSIGLLSNIPYSHPSASNVFGIGSEHPFANYWTCQGGLAEPISVLPEKLQADILLERYFDCVDPVYPMIDRQSFFADYEHFWSLTPDEKSKVDGTLVAMIFAMLAMGTQFVTTRNPTERQQTAEFCVSAAHQSLRISSYMNKASIRSIQAMVLITYFLINDNHASDGWAFAGILIRQAYAMGLHRDPNIVCPNSSIFEKQQRLKLWQAVLLQETFLAVLLSLPPSATHTDVSVSALTDDTSSNTTDMDYIRGCWTLANHVQESICSPRSLDLPLSPTPSAKRKLLSQFTSIHDSFHPIFTTWTPISLLTTPKRTVLQILFLTSNYHHNVMLVHSSASATVEIDIKGALEAAHKAIDAFFMLFKMFEGEARVWWVFNHRAFLEACCIGDIIRGAGKRGDAQPEEGEKGKAKNENGSIDITDPVVVQGRKDIRTSCLLAWASFPNSFHLVSLCSVYPRLV